MPVCEYCRPHRVLANENDLHQHLAADHPNRCTLCPGSVEFGSHYTWFSHYNTRHQARCPYCDAFIGRGNQAKLRHFKQVHAYHPCTICLTCFETEAELVVHYTSPDVEAHPHACARCNDTLVSGLDFWFHCFKEHKTRGGELLCPICNHEIPTSNEAWSNGPLQWKGHLKYKHQLVPCTECFEVFFNEYEGKQHFKDHHRVECPNCPATFPDDETKTNHFNTNHRFTCPNCPNISFPNVTLKEEHVHAAHKTKCSSCASYFDSLIEFEHHYIETHRSSCTYCTKSFATDELLLLHTNLAHKYFCTVCKEYLDHGANLQYHYEVLHRLPCDLCTPVKMCSTEAELKLHYRAVHGVGSKQVNKYVCTTCQEVCVSEHVLVMHYKNKHLRQWDVSPPRSVINRSNSTSD